jgi:hypothetical protein
VDVLHLDIVSGRRRADRVRRGRTPHARRSARPILDEHGGCGDGDSGARARRAVTLLEAATLVSIVRWEHATTAELSMLMALASHLAPRARVRLSRGPSEDIRALIDSAPSAVDDGPVLERAGWVRRSTTSTTPT